MNYSEEIKKLQARVKRLEQQLPTESLMGFSVVEPKIEIAKLTQAELEKLKLPEPRWSFTEDEKTILRNVSKCYEWIARDRYSGLRVFYTKPEKKSDIWNDAWFSGEFPFDHLFECIKWSDDEPCEFRKFL